MMNSVSDAFRRIHPVKLGAVIEGKPVVQTFWEWSPGAGDVPMFVLQGETTKRRFEPGVIQDNRPPHQRFEPVRLSAYAIHDDPDGHCSQCPEDLHWIAVAAESEDHARVLAAAFYDGEAPRDEWDWKTAFAIREVDTSTWPKRLQPQYPKHITDLESLRLMGWREEGKSECESCGLCAMGMKAYEICDDCECCKECCECVKCEFCEYRMDMCVCDDE